MILTPIDGVWRYVKVNGEYRFCPCNHWKSHSDLINKGETAESAGTIFIYDDDWTYCNTYSMTLKINADVERDIPELTKLLHKPYGD